MKISILGLGYVGFPLACAVAMESSHEIVGYDPNKEKINTIQSGQSPIDDARAELDIQKIKFEVSDNPDIIDNSDIYIVCVPTPVGADYLPDLNPVKSAVELICKYLRKDQIIIIESTINPGVCDELVIPLIEEKSGLKCREDFDVAHCPERINPGDEEWNVYNIPRNVGSSSARATKICANFYREFISGEINEMPDIKSTEATKIVENTFRDINIAFVNELAKSFDVLGINIDVVIRAASNKPFAFMPHFPSCGVGGHCIPVDPYYLIERAKMSGFDHKFLKLAREINNSMPAYAVDLLAEKLNEVAKPIKGTQIGLLGLSYKADIGDLRESPALKVKNLLLERGAKLKSYDPYFPDFSDVSNLEELLTRCEAIFIATNHKIFTEITEEQLIKNNVKVVVDGKNCLSEEIRNSKKIIYKGIGI